MIGSESFLEFLYGADNLGAGSFEYMKYKLWSQLTGSDRSACHYAILEMEKSNLLSPPFPCPISSGKSGRVFEGKTADYAPFFVAVDTTNGGTILSPEYVLTYGTPTAPTAVAYGIQPGQNITSVFSGPNVVSVTNVIQLSSFVVMLKVSPPIPFGPDVSAARVSDCSGPSNAENGKPVAFYGMGYDETKEYTDRVKVSCGEINQGCTNFFFPYYLCAWSTACIGDFGGPIMANGYYVVGLIYATSNCEGKLLVKSHFFINLFFFVPISEPATTTKLPIL